MREFRLPDPGEGLVEAEIVRWVVAEGDTVAVNDILVEIETAKSLVELPSPYAGTIARLLVAEGATVDVGTPIVQIDDHSPAEVSGPVLDAAGPGPVPQAVPGHAGEPAGPVPPGEGNGSMLVGYGAKSQAVARRPRRQVAAQSGPQGDQVHESYAVAQPVSRPIDQPTTTSRLAATPSGDRLPDPGQAPRPAGAAKRSLAKPPVRRLARDLGLDLDAIAGTGPDGTITAADVVAAAAAVNTVVGGGPAPAPATTRVPLRGVRREMAHAMIASLKVPQATVTVQAEVSATVELVETLKARREFAGLRVSPLLIFAKAAMLAIARNPAINASLDLEAGEIVQHADVNLGIAAATPRGLVVPNIKGANRMNLVELALALNDMVQIAKQGKVQPEHMTKGTFTITNVGVFGVDGGTPIVNPGESAILCLGTISRRPWVVGSGDDERIEPRWVCTLVLTFDHRLVDGEIASKYLHDVATLLADPGLALMF